MRVSQTRQILLSLVSESGRIVLDHRKQKTSALKCLVKLALDGLTQLSLISALVQHLCLTSH